MKQKIFIKWVLGVLIILISVASHAKDVTLMVAAVPEDFEHQLMYVTLQGIMNRDGAETLVYFNWGGGPELRWLSYLKKRFNVNKQNVKTLEELLGMAKKSGKVEGYVLWDPKNPETANVATTLAGIKNWFFSILC